jgi:two-component system cell cycle sensor histidine kinase/response regulator CckA
MNLYATGVQPPTAVRDDQIRGIAKTEQDLGSMVEELLESTRQMDSSLFDSRPLIDEIIDVRDSIVAFGNRMEGIGATDGPFPPSGDVMRQRVIAATEHFERLDQDLDALSRAVQRTVNELGAEHRRALEWRATSGAANVAILIAFAVVLSFLFYKSRQKARERAALIEDLRGAELRYRSMFDNAVEGMFQTTPDGRFITANRALARMYGYQSPQHLMASLSDIGTQLQVELGRRDALLKALQEDHIVLNFEIEVVRADGRAMWIRENVRAVRDEAGKILYLEGTVEDVSDRWWSEQRRRLQYATARILEKAGSVVEARPMILQNVCEILDWDMGAVWDVDPTQGALICVEVWHAPDIDITEFENAMVESEHRLGEGLAGEVWESGEPKWIANLAEDAQTNGARIAFENGMGSAFGVPIKVRGAVRHVVEFFSPKISLPDPELLQTLGLVANQLGHLIERKSAEEALRASEHRKTAIVQSALDCIVSFDLDGRIVEFNPAAERAFGIPQDEALGREVVGLIIPETLSASHKQGIALYTATNLSMAGGQRVELTALHSSGHEFPVEAAISRINIDGRPMFTAFLRDISERRRAERITSELAAVVANSNDAIIGCKIDGTIRSWNVGAENIYGWNADEAIGRPLEMLMPPDKQDECVRMLATVRRGESLANYETARLRKDGRKISVSLTDSPILDPEGKVTGLSSIARDITERKRLEEELLQSQKMEAVGRLAGGIAHDFNNILTAILGYSDLLIGQIESRHWMYRHLAEIRKAADFAAALTHQLLAFSRRQPLYLRVFAVNETVRNMQKMLQRVIGEHIKIRTEMTADVGLVKADPSQLEQVLLNLCVNARDAMPGGGAITITTQELTYFPDGDEAVNEMPAGVYVKLSVRDTGTGISPDVIKHIFEPFFTTKAQGQGTGLGLATCYGIVKQSGGYIDVESTVGNGATFSIYLPSVNEAGEKSAARKEGGQLAGGSETILYVEDESSVRRLTSHVLRRLGYTVLEAGDAQQARAVIEARGNLPIDLLFSDVVLPDCGGKEIADWLGERQPGVRLLFTSGYVDEAVLVQYGIDRATAFLQKPFAPGELACMVRDVLDRELPRLTARGFRVQPCSSAADSRIPN